MVRKLEVYCEFACVFFIKQILNLGSVMHYPAYGFAIDPSIPTIVPLQEGVVIGQRDGLSEVNY